MLSTIVLAPERAFGPDPPANIEALLLRTLAALVPLAVQGFVGEVCLAAPGGEATARIADEAGCGLAAASDGRAALALALARTRHPWVFVLLGGFAPEAGLADEAGDFMLAQPGRAAAMRAAPSNFAARLLPSLAPTAGLIMPREKIQPAPPSDLGRLARSAGPCATLRTTARKVG